MKEKIWYCSYGSNLSFERFKLYLFGGNSPIIDNDYVGCSNKTKPERNEFFKIPYQLYFAKHLNAWKGAVAFIDDKKNPDYETLTRIYLIDIHQFEEVVEQENQHFENSKRFTLDLDVLKKNGFILLGNEKENQFYGKVILVGYKNNHPIISFTSKWNLDDVKFNKPSERYLKTIIKGLSESKITKDEVFNYLSKIKGIENFYSTNNLKKIINEIYYKKPKLLTIKGTSDINRNGQYWVQLNENIFGKNSWDRPDFCLITRQDMLAEIKARVEYLGNDLIEQNIIKMDMKYRCALSVSKGNQILVSPIRKTDDLFVKNQNNSFRRLLNKIFGIQTNILRVNRTTYNDMEVNICRISKESMNIIGVEHGDFVILESAYGKAKVRALEMTEFIVDEMKKRSRDNKNADFNCAELLDIKGVEKNLADIQPILIDYDLRLKLKVNQCTPILIRRSLSYEIRKKIHYVATPIILTIVASVLSFKYFNNDISKIIVLMIGSIILILLSIIPIKRI